MSTAATALSVTAAGLGVVASLTAKKPATLANPMEWQSNPQAGIPHVMGRMYFGGQIVYRQTYEKDNKAERIHTVYSTGPIKGFEGFYVSGVLTTVTGETANINDRGKLLVGNQRGQQPEAVAFGGQDAPGITAASKLSGLAASSITLFYDSKGSQTFTTEPQCGYVVLGTPVYDPRKDSTYPGGNGPQRSNDESTWDYLGYDNPGLKALSYLVGYRQSGKLVIGVGLPITSIIVSQFVEMANVCDANGWKLGGITYSTDKRWTVFTQILQAGGAVPLRTGTMTGCMVNTPKVSLATFEISDIIGDWSIQATQSRRDRINAIVPRYMAEQSLVGETTDSTGNVVLQTTVSWGMAAAGPVVVSDYVTFDGGSRQKEIEYPFVTGVSTGNNAPNQIAQLARYDIENAREFGPISLPMKPRWMGYRAGDVITGGASLTELGLVGQDIMLLQRQFSPGNMTVTFTARSETSAKHPFALGQTTTAPPTPSLTGPALIPIPGNSAWALTGGQLVAPNGQASAALFLVGAVDSDVIDAIVVEYRESTGDQDVSADWIAVTTLQPASTGVNISNVKDQTEYQVAVSYRKGAGTGGRLILGPATAGQTQVPWSGGVSDPTGTKPQDNATVGAPAGTSVNGVPVEFITQSIDSLTEQAADLVATYGDTASAAASAGAAQAAKTAAETAQSIASAAQSQAQDAVTAAQQAQQTAASAAGSASTYADGAASSSAASAASASAAHLSEVSADLTAALLFPSAFNASAKWASQEAGSPTSVLSSVYDQSFYTTSTWDNFADYTNGNGQFREVTTVGVITPIVGHTYDIEVRVNGLDADKNGAPVCISGLDFVELDATYNQIDAVGSVVPGYSGVINNGSAFGVQIQKVRYTKQATDTGVFLRPRWYGNYSGGAGNVQPNMHYALYYFRVTDVTELLAGEAAAASASNYSTAAAGYSDTAGQYASAAQGSATAAGTSAGQANSYAGNASTSASQASTSASNAAGSANSASSYAQQAANSRDAAGGSAGAAATSASVAQSASSDAASSASSASSSANDAYNQAANALSFAQAASSSSAVANSAAAAAQQSATLSASVAGGTLNTNVSFDVWPDAGGMPTVWQPWDNGTGAFNISRQGGTGGHPYAAYQTTDGGTLNGMVQAGIRMSRGWWVLELDALIDGSFSGMGMGLHGSTYAYDINCATDADVNGVVRSASENPFWYYRWRKLIQCQEENYGAAIYAFAAWNGLGDISAARKIYWERVAVRPATDGEIAGQRADVNANSALAQISVNQAAQAAVNSAQATFNTNINTSVGANSSAISDLQTAVSNNYASATQQITTLQSYVTAGTNLSPDLSKWSVTNGFSYSSGSWGPDFTGTIGQTGEFQIAVSPLISVDINSSYTLSFDPLALQASGCYVYADFIGYDANQNIAQDSNNTPQAVNVNFSDSRARSTYCTVNITGGNVQYVRIRLIGSNPNGGTALLGGRKFKFERGSVPTAYTTEGETASLAASVTVLQATTTDLQNRINTAVFQVAVEAGSSRALLKMFADGYGASSIDLVAGSIHLWSQDGANAIEALSVDATGLVTIPNLAAQQIRASHFVTDQGVDLAALVYGALASRTSGAWSGGMDIGAGGNSGYISQTGVVSTIGNPSITALATINASKDAGSHTSGNLSVYLGYNINGAGWNTYLLGVLTFSASTTTQQVNVTFAPGWSGKNVQFALYCSVGNANSDGVTLNSATLNLSYVNYK